MLFLPVPVWISPITLCVFTAAVLTMIGCVPGYGKNRASTLSVSGARVLVTGFHSSAIKDVDHDEL